MNINRCSIYVVLTSDSAKWIRILLGKGVLRLNAEHIVGATGPSYLALCLTTDQFLCLAASEIVGNLKVERFRFLMRPAGQFKAVLFTFTATDRESFLQSASRYLRASTDPSEVASKISHEGILEIMEPKRLFRHVGPSLFLEKMPRAPRKIEPKRARRM